jgi:hypothetical protein
MPCFDHVRSPPRSASVRPRSPAGHEKENSPRYSPPAAIGATVPPRSAKCSTVPSCPQESPPKNSSWPKTPHAYTSRAGTSARSPRDSTAVMALCAASLRVASPSAPGADSHLRLLRHLVGSEPDAEPRSAASQPVSPPPLHSPLAPSGKIPSARSRATADAVDPSAPGLPVTIVRLSRLGGPTSGATKIKI